MLIDFGSYINTHNCNLITLYKIIIYIVSTIPTINIFHETFGKYMNNSLTYIDFDTYTFDR